ncbi:MAG: hypothetical protein ACI8RD_010786 [Bacillariaceae sp.]|jgi:hypothetical protein
MAHRYVGMHSTYTSYNTQNNYFLFEESYSKRTFHENHIICSTNFT